MLHRASRPTPLNPSNAALPDAAHPSNASSDGVAPPTGQLHIGVAIAPTDAPHSTAPQLVRPGDVGELVLMLPGDLESRGARAWLWDTGERVVRCIACVHCGGRVETLVSSSLSDVRSASASPRHTRFREETHQAVQAFAADHATCTGDTFDTLPYGCPESTWDVPTAVAAVVRYAVDEVLDERLVTRAIEGPWAGVDACARRPDGSLVRHAWRLDVPGMGVPADQIRRWQASVQAWAAAAEAELLGAVTTARAWFLDDASGNVMHEAYVGLATPHAFYAATLPPRPCFAPWHEPEDLRWERMTRANPVLDGFFASLPQQSSSRP